MAAGLLLAGILAAFVHPWVRPEDLFIALVLVGGLRLLLRPLPIPTVAPRRVLALRARVFVFPVGIEASDHLLPNLASYPWRDLPRVTMARAGDEVEIVTGSGGGVYR